MENNIILYGAGAAGRWALSHLRSQGIDPLCFVDSDSAKWGTEVDGLKVYEPIKAKTMYHAAWVACSIRHDYAQEIRTHITALEVNSKPLWECLPVCHGLPPNVVNRSLGYLIQEEISKDTLLDQYEFRFNPHYDTQIEPSDIRDIYFPDFIKHRADEHFVDCGAADGDTVQQFIKRWPQYEQITAFEPDPYNRKKLIENTVSVPRLLQLNIAVSDYYRLHKFSANGDYSSHLGGEGSFEVICASIDETASINETLKSKPPTYIKMDIEGAELEALWGARKTLKEHSPVLAICAYHTSDHFWQIPLLIHAIQPEYQLFFRRYAEGAFELVWYAVPSERVNNEVAISSGN